MPVILSGAESDVETISVGIVFGSRNGASLDFSSE